MHVVHFQNAEAFGKRVLPFLEKAEAENCFFIGFIPRLKSGDVFVAIEGDAGEVEGVAIKTPDRHLSLTTSSVEAADVLADDLVDRAIDPVGVQARPAVARCFAERYSLRTGRSPRLEAAMAIHQLDHVTPAQGVPGSLRQAAIADLQLLTHWFNAFSLDCHLPPAPDPTAAARDRIERGGTFFWCSGGQEVSTASVTGPTPRGIRVNFVYTLPEFRGRGYASACVATLSQRMLDAGRKFCFLYTDLANPTSNKIYRAIGYHRIADSDQYMFATPGS